MKDRLKIVIAYIAFILRNVLPFKKIKIMNVDETIEHIVNTNDSLIRFGDGEVALIRGFDIKFQKCNEDLKRDLIEALSCTIPGVMVAIPDVFGFKAISQYRKTERQSWIVDSLFSYPVYSRFCVGGCYYTSLVSRLYLPFCCDYDIAVERFKKIRKVWDQKDILIVEGEHSRLGVGNDLFKNANSIKRIICPSKNAYSAVNNIEAAIRMSNSKYSFDIVIIALGPTAKVLACRLSKELRVLDLGHIDVEYEWLLRKTDRKIAINGKEVNEVANFDIQDEKYNNEIIMEIKDCDDFKSKKEIYS